MLYWRAGRVSDPRGRRAGAHLPRTPRRHEALPQDRRLHLLRLRRHHVVRSRLQGPHLGLFACRNRLG